MSLWSGGPPSVPNRRIGFFSSLQSGARGEAWLHASHHSCWHACVIKPNETAHCSQRMDTGRRSNPPASTQQRSPRWPPSAPAFIFIPFQHVDTGFCAEPNCFGSHDQCRIMVMAVWFHVTLTRGGGLTSSRSTSGLRC